MEKILEFLKIAGKLKFTYRFSGSFGKEKESTAAHSWRIALIAILIAEELNLDISMERALKIAIVHDIAESICGDVDARLIENNDITKEEKDQLEVEAINQLKDSFPNGYKIKELWQEYQNNKTKEAKFIKALDKIETLLFMTEVGYKSYNRQEFAALYADKYIKDFPELLPLLKVVKLKLKEEFKKGEYEWKDKYNYSL